MKYQAATTLVVSSWCHDLLSALGHCHSNHIILRTLQPDQIVVDLLEVVCIDAMSFQKLNDQKK
jgi:serine/threonine protein kinase